MRYDNLIYRHIRFNCIDCLKEICYNKIEQIVTVRFCGKNKCPYFLSRLSGRSKILSNKYTHKEISYIFYNALGIFNDCLDADFTPENTLLVFFTPKSGLKVYEKFCGEHFPKFLNENYKAEGYFETFMAQAFIGDRTNGVMVRSDIWYSLEEVYRVFLHELSHIFCIRTEFNGKNFFDIYCAPTDADSGIYSAGYTVWREAIVDIMADAVTSDYTSIKFRDIVDEIRNLYEGVRPYDANSKKSISLIIADVMFSAEVAGMEKWTEAEAAIRKYLPVTDEVLIRMLGKVFRTLHKPPFWHIDPEFIFDLGFDYIEILSRKSMALFKDHLNDKE